MTKKHYEAIAKAFHAYISTNTGANIARPIAKDLADYFQTDNRNFDRARFLQACGIDTRQPSTIAMEQWARWNSKKSQT